MSWERATSLCAVCSHGKPLFGGVEYRCSAGGGIYAAPHDTLPKGRCERFELAPWGRRGNGVEVG